MQAQKLKQMQLLRHIITVDFYAACCSSPSSTKNYDLVDPDDCDELAKDSAAWLRTCRGNYVQTAALKPTPMPTYGQPSNG